MIQLSVWQAFWFVIALIAASMALGYSLHMALTAFADLRKLLSGVDAERCGTAHPEGTGAAQEAEQ